jgi:hypothetical protein
VLLTHRHVDHAVTFLAGPGDRRESPTTHVRVDDVLGPLGTC